MLSFTAARVSIWGLGNNMLSRMHAKELQILWQVKEFTYMFYPCVSSWLSGVQLSDDWRPVQAMLSLFPHA